MRSLLFCLSILGIVTNATAQETSVLFIGNSYIYTQNLPNTLYNLALAGGDTIYHESSTPGGYTFQGHSSNATTLNKIASRDWDFVVLQEQSQRPSFPDWQVEQDVYPYAEELVDSIKSNYECTEPVFFMTWGRRDGDQQNCAGFPPLCTFEGMQERLRNAYLQMTVDNDATVAPCGAAWQQMALVNSTFWYGLYSGDGSHPSAWGTYLNACVFYATIFRQSPVGIPYYSTIGQQDAEDLQQLAEDIVLDSLSNWYIGHQDIVADIDYVQSGGSGPQVQFSNGSQNVSDHYWDFGDGMTSTEASPQYNFDQGIWDVTYIGSSACGVDTAEVQISVPLGIDEQNRLDRLSVIQIGNQLSVENTLSEYLKLSVVDVSGRIIIEVALKPHGTKTLNLNGNSGVHLLRISNDSEFSVRKFVVN